MIFLPIENVGRKITILKFDRLLLRIQWVFRLTCSTWGVSYRSINAKDFPDAMLFLQVFVGISIQFGGFSDQH